MRYRVGCTCTRRVNAANESGQGEGEGEGEGEGAGRRSDVRTTVPFSRRHTHARTHGRVNARAEGRRAAAPRQPDRGDGLTILARVFSRGALGCGSTISAIASGTGHKRIPFIHNLPRGNATWKMEKLAVCVHESADRHAIRHGRRETHSGQQWSPPFSIGVRASLALVSVRYHYAAPNGLRGARLPIGRP